MDSFLLHSGFLSSRGHPRRDRRPHEPPVGGGLGSRERRGLANITEVETGQLPLPVLADKHQRGAHLHVHGIAPIGRLPS